MIHLRFLLFPCLALALCACGGGGGGGGPAPSVRLTGEVLDMLGGGSDDFTTMAAKLREALADDPASTSAQILLASVVALEFFKQSLADAPGPNAAPGDLRSLLERSGVQVLQSGGFWTTELRLEDHGHGKIKDSFPPALAWLEFLERDLLPVLRDWITAIDSVPADFEVPLRVTATPYLFERLKLGTGERFLDYGDLRALSFVLGLARSLVALITSYESQNLVLNELDTGDGPDVDPWNVLETKYPNAGKLRAGNRLNEMRTWLTSAWDSYLAASSWIRGENVDRSERGVLTLGRGRFTSAQELQAFLLEEEGFRNWGDGIVTALSQPAAYTIPTEPNGTNIPVANRMTISFARFFQGVSFRDVMFSTIVDPLTGKKALGTATIAELTPQIATLGGILVRLYGRPLRSGDLQQFYSVRITPGVDDKIADGNLSDWDETDVVLLERPEGSVKSPYPDLGVLRGALAKTDRKLFLYLDSDPIKYMVEASDSYTLRVRGNSGFAELSYRTGIGDRALSSNSDPSWFRAGPPGGLEIEIPLSNFAEEDDWVEVELSVVASTQFFEIDSTRRMFVDIRAR